MPSFSYRGRSAGGEAVQGIAEGATAAAVADFLSGQGITPLDIEPAKRRGVGAALSFLQPNVDHTDVLLFSRQLYTLMKAGVPIMRALLGLQESASSPANTC